MNPAHQSIRAVAHVFLRSLREVRDSAPILTLLLFALLVLQGLCPISIALVAKRLFDALQAGQHHGALAWLVVEAALAAALALALQLLVHIRNLIILRYSQSVRLALMRDVLSRPLLQREDAGFQDRFSRVWREAGSRPVQLALRGFSVLQALVTGTGAVCLLAGLQPWLAIGVLLAALPAFIAENRYSKSAFGFFDWAQPWLRRQSYVEQLVSNQDHAQELRSLQLQKRLLHEHQRAFTELEAPQRRLAGRYAALGSLLRLVTVASVYAMSAWLILRTTGDTVSIGTLVMGLGLLKEGSGAVNQLLDGLAGMVENYPHVAMHHAFLDESVTLPPDGVATSGPRPEDGLELCGVTFSYPGSERPAVEAVDLHLRPGKTVALVGVNGAGKSTLVKLACGLYEPTQGTVQLDGLPLVQWRRQALLAQVSVLLQTFIRYQWTLRDNVEVGNVSASLTDSELATVLDQAQASEVVAALPAGTETQLGRWFEGGVELSGGQWQRIALARTFARRSARLWILDEPSSALDIHAEAQMHELLRQNAGDKMVLLISHRMGTVRHADEIVVLEHGRVVERGTHAELMAIGGRYRTMFDLQAASLR
jgi:ATP-binding cassette subfamily B protein